MRGLSLALLIFAVGLMIGYFWKTSSAPPEDNSPEASVDTGTSSEATDKNARKNFPLPGGSGSKKSSEEEPKAPSKLQPALADRNNPPEMPTKREEKVALSRLDIPPPPTTSIIVDDKAIIGFARFSGNRPAVKPLTMRADPVCLKANSGPVMDESIVVNEDSTLANVFVYVKEGLDRIKPPPISSDEIVVLDQKGCRYIPHVLGIRVGQVLKILNSDTTAHNVHSLSKFIGFNNAMPTAGMKIAKKFGKSEIMVPLKCDIHGWMSAYIGVLDHPYFSVTDSQGVFRISGLPEGHYKLEAWHETLGTKTFDVDVDVHAPTKASVLTFVPK